MHVGGKCYVLQSRVCLLRALVLVNAHRDHIRLVGLIVKEGEKRVDRAEVLLRKGGHVKIGFSASWIYI
jgi:hypothetical protein